MDPSNGLYTDLDSFTTGISNCSATNNGFIDNACPTLPSLNNFKYQQTNLLTNNVGYQQQTLHDLQQPKSSSSSSQNQNLPQTQININNCNNNIFFPHDDGLFDAGPAASCASTSGQKSGNFIGHVRKELGTVGSGGGGGGGDKNVYFNINNINTNIVNNIQNPTNFVGGSDLFGANQYHQINKTGETIINFTNNNLNSAGASMPADTVSATTQNNYYGYQSNSGGQQTVFEQQQSSYQDASKTAMGSSGNGHFQAHQQNATSSLNQQSMTNGGGFSGNANAIPIPAEHAAPSMSDPFNEYPEPLSTATKIINNFESKNPLKYPTQNRSSGASNYYKNPSEFSSHQFPPHVNHHGYHNLFPPAGGIQATITKVPTAPHYEPYQRIPRNATHFPNQHSMDEHNRMNYNRAPAVPVHGHYSHPHPMQHPQNNYANFYPNGYNPVPYPTYQMPGPPAPFAQPMLRNESCSKTATNYNNKSAPALPPVEHGNYAPNYLNAPNYAAAQQKKDFYGDQHYYQHGFFEDPNQLNSCAKKPVGRPKNTDLYTPNGYLDHHSMPHHPQNGMRNVGYQPMPPKHFASNSYPMPANSCDPYYNYKYKPGEYPMMPKMNPAKQFKNYGHFEPMPHPYQGYPQYHTMQAKHPEKIKISIDLEEQINSSKIPKLRDPSYGYEQHHPHHYFPYHHMPSRNVEDPKNSIANINISLRDFLSTWNEIDEDEERLQPVDDISEHVERSIMREYNPMFVQKAVADAFVEAPSVDNARSELESDGTEKLYVLESIDVPLADLNKYKHLSVINKLPENVVINDCDVDASMEIDLAREKLYKSEFELEFEACQERKIAKPIEEPPVVVVTKVEKLVEKEILSTENEKIKQDEVKKSESEASDEKCANEKKRKVRTPKLKSEKIPKIKQNILKLKKEKILKASKDPRKMRMTKRVKKYSLNQHGSSVKSLKSICVDFVNTSAYRNYARQQYSIIDKFSKQRILKDFKKKFNFDGMKRANAAVNQKSNHSVRINSLREICGQLLKEKLLEINEDEEEEEFSYIEDEEESFESENDELPSLMELSKRALSEMDISVVENDFLYSPMSLKELCETLIYNNRQYFVIEEVSNVPKLQDLCKAVLSETNIFINLDGESEAIFELEDAAGLQAIESVDDEPIYIVEESSGNVGELFESENLNSFEKSEILRKIQRVASIEDDDEIIRAIGALHRDDDVESIINNNDSNVSNKNISNFGEMNGFVGDEMKFDSEVSFLSYMDDELMQYEEIVPLNDTGNKASKKFLESLRLKYLNRADVRQATRTLNSILKKALSYQRAHRFHNANRRGQIEALKQQARAALSKLREAKSCDKVEGEARNCEEIEFEVRNFEKIENEVRNCEKLDEEAENCGKTENEVRNFEEIKMEAKNGGKTENEVRNFAKTKMEARNREKNEKKARNCEKLEEDVENSEKTENKVRNFEKIKMEAKNRGKIEKKTRNCEKFEEEANFFDKIDDEERNFDTVDDEAALSREDEAESLARNASPVAQQEPEDESQLYAKDEEAQSSPLISRRTAPIIDDSPVDDFYGGQFASRHAERNLPQLPSVFPSINEYKIDRKSSNRCDMKDIDDKPRKLSFDESLLCIEKSYGKSSAEENRHRHVYDKRSSRSSSHRRRHSHSHRHHSSRRSSRSRSHRSTRSKSRERRNNSSRHNAKDQMKHSEAKRLVIPSYKIYDKDLDVKLKIMPFVRIEREERVDDMVKQFN